MTEQTTDADLLIDRDRLAPGVLEVTFNRPERRNAFTKAMYGEMRELWQQVRDDRSVRVVVLRGAGGKAFAAGNEISDFVGNEDVVEYENWIRSMFDGLSSLPQVTVAAIDGVCVGGGLAVATYCDLRVATRASRFGYPIARTLGNTLSAASYALAVRHFGHARTVDMVLTARLLDAEEARTSGFVTRIADDLTPAVDALIERLLAHAPLTMWAAKETLRRLHARAGTVDADDVVDRVYGSTDFAAGVAAFTQKTRPTWRGR